MKFGYTIIYVPDVVSAITFYSAAFNLQIGFIHENQQYGELNTGDTKLAFVSDTLAQSQKIPYIKNSITNEAAGIEIAFIADDVLLSYRLALKNGARAVQEPIEKPWGQTVAYVRDLNGVLIEIGSPINEKSQ